MAVASISDGLMSVSQLRERVGGASEYEQVSGFVLDDEFLVILNEERTSLAFSAAEEARRRLLGGENLLIGEAKTIGLDASGDHPGLWMSKVPDGYFPFAFGATDEDGFPLAYDPQIFRTAHTSFAQAFRYHLQGRRILVLIPDAAVEDKTPREATFYFATEKEVSETASPMAVAEANERAVAKAARMLKRRIEEYERQEDERGFEG